MQQGVGEREETEGGEGAGGEEVGGGEEEAEAEEGKRHCAAHLIIRIPATCFPLSKHSIPYLPPRNVVVLRFTFSVTLP